MGAIIFKIENLVESILETCCIKTGINIDEDMLCEILNTEYPTNPYFHDLKDNRTKTIRIRSETYEEFCSTIRHKLGELEGRDYDLRSHMDIMLNFEKDGHDYMAANQFVLGLITSHAEKGKHLEPEELLQINNEHTKYPEELVIEIYTSFLKMRMRSNYVHPQEKKVFDGGTNIEDLFEKELIPKTKDGYIDQKFINYLHANPDKLDKINWRNFERLTAEFFTRFGFKTELGPGRGDGGIDIKVFSESEKTPLFIIQCKRYKEGNEVEINAVKAFHTDVEFEGAQFGLVATTSKIAPGGKSTCSIRKYPMAFAENGEIKAWVNKMKRKY